MCMQIFNCAGVGTPKLGVVRGSAVLGLSAVWRQAALFRCSGQCVCTALLCAMEVPGEFALMAGVLQLWGEGCTGWIACRWASACTSFSINPCPANRSGGENLLGLPVPAHVSPDSCI